MTFTATSPSLLIVAEAHGLIRLDSVTTPGGEVRQLWMMPEAYALLIGETDQFFPAMKFARAVERFILGHLVTVSLIGDPETKLPDVEMMHTVDEVWLLCCRKPKAHQYRFFGRFTAKGEFVVLFGRTRKSLENGGYATAAQEFIDQWLAMFGNHDCWRAGTCEDYCGGVVSDVYDDED